MKKFLGILFILIVYVSFTSAQEKLVDRVIATVGNSFILQSDLNYQYETQYIAQGNKPDNKVKCYFLQQLLTQKLLAQQAIIDSIEVTETEVDDELNRRIKINIQKAGGKERLEEFLNRSILQHQEEMRPLIGEQLKGEKMQRKLVSKIDVTPQEVKKFFEGQTGDSIYFGTEIEYSQLVIDPVLTKEEKNITRAKVEGYRQQILNGTEFATIARLYSEDGSAPYGGESGYQTRDYWAKEFSAMAFKLKPGELSPVFETQFGFHLLQVLDRRGEEVNVRYIVITHKPTPASLERAKAKIDSIADQIKLKKFDFATAASLYSDDKETKFSGGVVTNPEDRSNLIPMEALDDVNVFNAIDPLKPGEISTPILYRDKRSSNSTTYRIYYLKNRIAPHKASFEQDFAKIKEYAKQDKINRKLSEWFESRRETTYIDINPEFMDCDELKIWTKNTQIATK